MANRVERQILGLLNRKGRMSNYTLIVDGNLSGDPPGFQAEKRRIMRESLEGFARSAFFHGRKMHREVCQAFFGKRGRAPVGYPNIDQPGCPMPTHDPPV